MYIFIPNPFLCYFFYLIYPGNYAFQFSLWEIIPNTFHNTTEGAPSKKKNLGCRGGDNPLVLNQRSCNCVRMSKGGFDAIEQVDCLAFVIEQQLRPFATNKALFGPVLVFDNITIRIHR